MQNKTIRIINSIEAKLLLAEEQVLQEDKDNNHGHKKEN